MTTYQLITAFGTLVQAANNTRARVDIVAGVKGALRMISMCVLLFATILPSTAAAENSPLGFLSTLVPQLMGEQKPLDLSGCEKPSDIPFFAHAGCPGFLSDLRAMDVQALSQSRAQVVLYLDGLTTPLYGDKTFFVNGSAFMHALPPRLPIKMRMLKLRTPELIGLHLHDTFRMANSVLEPLLNAPTGDPVAQLRTSMRKLGIDPLPTTVLPMLGTHDAYLLQTWAEADPEGLNDFLARVQAVIDAL